MLVYVDRDSFGPDYSLMGIDEVESPPHPTERIVEIPDELMARYKKAESEYREVQKLLRELLGD